MQEEILATSSLFSFRLASPPLEAEVMKKKRKRKVGQRRISFRT